MTSRLRFPLASTVGPALTLTLALSGCGDSFHAGPMRYVESEKMAVDFKVDPKLEKAELEKAELQKAELQKAVRRSLASLFGANPTRIKVPEGAGLPGGGIYLASHQEVGKGRVRRVQLVAASRPSDPYNQEGGYGLYRKHCLHCHGVSGAGDGPTSTFLYPRPRDYRKGTFKFTSTPNGAKPSRDDLRKTIRNGLHGTSMPAFEALMSEPEIEQVVDYMIFLSMRGETERQLIDEAASTLELSDETVGDVAKSVFDKWKAAGGQVMNPPVPRPPSTRESVERGRELFLGLNKTGNKVDCTSCHGPQALGDGPSFVDQAVFNEVVFSGSPSEQGDRLNEAAKRLEDEVFGKTGDRAAGKSAGDKLREAWKNSLDDWGQPLRPNNLNRGLYKGGRRPIDLYWRIAKGINGAKMPAHYPTLEPKNIWDLVNFVLALPDEPALLEGATLPVGAAPPLTPAVAGR